MATYEQDIVIFETKENGDKTIKMPISRVNNIEGIGRSISTAYTVGDVVYVDNNKKVALKCTQAGTTSSSELDVSTANVGNVITDGTVKWQVCNRTSDVTSVNGKTGDVVVDVPVQSVNGMIGEVEIKESPSDMTDYITESYRNGTEWYEVYKSGKVRQGGKVSLATYEKKTITLLKPMKDTNYIIYGVDMSGVYQGSPEYMNTLAIKPESNTQIYINHGNYSVPYSWVVEGQGA